MMYHTPQIYNAKDYKREVTQERMIACKDECIFEDLPCDEDVDGMCKIIMEEKDLQLTGDPYQAVDVYVVLKNEIEMLLAE